MVARRVAAGRRRFCRDAGFTYIGLLVMVALIGVALAAAAQVASLEMKRQREAQLLFVGNAFREAIESYYRRSPGAIKSLPQSLEDLLTDRRFPNVVRHLRRVYVDPMTGKSDWLLIRDASTGISGIRSQSQSPTLKRAGFDTRDASFAGATTYSDWRFEFQPETVKAAPGAAAGAGVAGASGGAGGGAGPPGAAVTGGEVGGDAYRPTVRGPRNSRGGN